MRQCTKCGITKQEIDFYIHDIITNNLRGECKECTKSLKSARIKKYPLKRRLSTLKHRCNNPNASDYKYYGGKGIKCLLSLEELKFIWARDLGDLMYRPTVDRIDSNGNYTLDNCRILEHVDNVKRSHAVAS